MPLIPCQVPLLRPINKDNFTEYDVQPEMSVAEIHTVTYNEHHNLNTQDVHQQSAHDPKHQQLNKIAFQTTIPNFQA